MKSFTIALFIVVLCLAGFSRASYAQEKVIRFASAYSGNRSTLTTITPGIDS